MKQYDIWMPHPTSVQVWRMGRTPKALNLKEGPVASDPTSSKYPETAPINGYGGSGDVTAEVVYVNYGLIEDYASLDSLGLSVKGKIVIARYGRNYRGIKAKLAEEHKAAGLLLYSDPGDDGYSAGDPYPRGPWRPMTGIQRGSILARYWISEVRIAKLTHRS